MLQNQRIVDVARGWVGTRFHHQGRVKKTAQHKGGVDCLGLLVGVASELGLAHSDGTPLAFFDSTDYPHYPDTAFLQSQLKRLLSPIAINQARPGDILLFSIEGQPQHLGIVSDYADGLGIIHAFAPAKSVVEHALDAYWADRIMAAFRF